MNPSDFVNGDDDDYTHLLARYSVALLAGAEADPADDPALSVELRQRLERNLDCLRRLLQVPRQHPRPEATMEVTKSGITLHDSVVGKQMGRFRVYVPSARVVAAPFFWPSIPTCGVRWP